MSSREERAVIGRILAPHGLTGLVRVLSFSDHRERFALLKSVELARDDELKTLHIEKARESGRWVYLRFAGINTREDAAALRGFLLQVPLQERLTLPEGHYYHDQLVGLTVQTTRGMIIGVVEDITITGGHDLLAVRRNGESGKAMLIPLVRAYIRSVDLQAAEITVELPAGFLEI